MILDILSHTPAWVFAVFVALLVLGARRTRPTTIGVARLFVLPAAMAGLSLFGVVQSFGIDPPALAAWTVAFGAVAAAGALRPMRTDARSRVTYSPRTRTLRVPGSWLPLALMMTIFFLRYAVAVALAMHPALGRDTTSAVAIAAVCGLVSGCFAARAASTWRAAVREPSAGAGPIAAVA